MIIDSHCHLSMSEFKDDLPKVISNAKNNNVRGFVNICTNLDEINDIKKISDMYNIWFSIGVHPNNVKSSNINDLDKIYNFVNEKNLVGIGETGLDYHYGKDNRSLQKEFFLKHIEISRDLDLPLIVHTRNADKDTIEILKKEYSKAPFRGLIHCFTASKELAEEALKINFSISLSGIITFKNAESLRKIAKSIPLNRLLVETDSPYLAPVPKRGRRNEPAYLYHITKYLSEMYKHEHDFFIQNTTENFFKLFNKAKLDL